MKRIVKYDGDNEAHRRYWQKHYEALVIAAFSPNGAPENKIMDAVRREAAIKRALFKVSAVDNGAASAFRDLPPRSLLAGAQELVLTQDQHEYLMGKFERVTFAWPALSSDD